MPLTNNNRTNLILVHMESMSSFAWATWREELPVLNRLYQESERFRSAFVASTSTDMARMNLFTGTDRAYDRFARFPDHKEADFSGEQNLFEVLARYGYRVEGVSYEDYVNPATKYMVDWNIWRADLHHPFQYLLDRDQLATWAQDALSDAGGPFAVYFQNLFPHIQYGLEQKSDAPTFGEALKRGYQELDRSVGLLLDTLRKNHALDHTLLFFYGDHGDDYWWHGFNPVLAHGLPPYSTQIHVPVFLYLAGKNGESHTEPISTTECAAFLLRELGIEASWRPARNVSEGGPGVGKIVFSQNMFLNQPVRHLWDRGFCAVSANYLFLATNRGAALYDWHADPVNQCNLLPFFKFDKDGIPHLRELGEYPISNAMLSPAIREQIQRELPILRTKLRAYLAEKAEELGPELKNPVSDSYFSRILPDRLFPSGKGVRSPWRNRVSIQFHYYASMVRDYGAGYTLIRAWKRIRRGGRRENRGW